MATKGVKAATRVVHLTDIHFTCAPRLSELLSSRRLVGAANLYLLGRKRKFSLDVQKQVVEAVMKLKPGAMDTAVLYAL